MFNYGNQKRASGFGLKKRNELTNNVCELIRFYLDNTNIGDCEPFIGKLSTFLKDK